MAHMRALFLGVVVLLTAAQAFAASASRDAAFDEAELLAGAALPLSGTTSLVIPTSNDVFALDEEMRAFVAPLAGIRDTRQRLLALTQAMADHGMFSLEYAETTRTATATFHERQGNCLSFTMLFVGLARAAGLPAAYQTVEVRPTWSNDGQVVIANHVNAAVRTSQRDETIVDFNIRALQGEQHSRRVSDQYALGLFFTNLGAEALMRREYEASLSYLREAARVQPEIAGVWVNLGVLYARHGQYEHAEASYLRALELDESEQSALANLVLVYEALEESELANEYRRRVQSYRERNPYYHYSVATRAYEREEFADALTAVRKALRLKPDEHEFYTLRGQALRALGRARNAEQSFARAREYQAIEYQRAQAPVRFEGFGD
jgi:Flp pilus assembly protein TadD